MKKILIYISPERYSSLFDLILGYDGGADVVVPYSDTQGEELRDVVYSCVYTRGTNGRKNTAIFVGGPDVAKGEEFMETIQKIFKELPPEFRVSITADPHGAHTTSSACAVKIMKAIPSVKGMKATILAGTGPVGQSISVLLAKAGCEVTMTSRDINKAMKICRILKDKYNVKITPYEAGAEKTIDKAVSDADIVVSTGPEGVNLLQKKTWTKHKKIKVLADVNAVPPYGIEGVDPRDDCRETPEGRIAIGALAIGSLKIRCHHKLIEKLFEEKGRVLDLEKIYEIAASIDR